MLVFDTPDLVSSGLIFHALLGKLTAFRLAVSTDCRKSTCVAMTDFSKGYYKVYLNTALLTIFINIVDCACVWIWKAIVYLFMKKANVRSFIRSFVCFLFASIFVCSLVCLFIRPLFVRSFFRSFVRPFYCRFSFVCGFMAISKSINPYHAEFLKWNNPPSIFGTVHYHFRDIEMKT